MKSLFQMAAEEGSNIPRHINKLLGWYEWIILANDPEFMLHQEKPPLQICHKFTTIWTNLVKCDRKCQK